MSRGIRKTIMDALSQHRGDDLERARAAFSHLTQKQMHEPWGQTGKTPNEILAEYEAHATDIDKARDWVDANL